MAGKYIYEIMLNPKDISDLMAKQDDFNKSVRAIVDKYKEELKRLNVTFDDTYGFDGVHGIVKIKPIQVDLPQDLREELEAYYNHRSDTQ